MPRSSRRLVRVSGAFILLACLAIPFSDLAIYNVEPWQELSRMAQGLLNPSWYSAPVLMQALGHTLAFALLAVVISACVGLLLALLFKWRVIRILCASTRAVHELFWGLIFMQLYGLSATTGLLAIIIPFTGMFAKVYAEIFEQQSTLPASTLEPPKTIRQRVSMVCYTLLPQAWPELAKYTRYRFECALRSSTILGFIGLPTLGFYLETAFKQGQYQEAATLLLVFFGVIATIRFWLNVKCLPIYLVAAVVLLPSSPEVSGSYMWQFISQDIWPKALLAGDLSGALAWYQQQLLSVALPAVWDTLLLSQLALVVTGMLVLVSYPWASHAVIKTKLYWLGKTLLLVMRSTPEMIFAFIGLLLFGPSMIPAVIALALHNAGLIAYLVASQSQQLSLRADAPQGFNRYLYEFTPRLYPQIMTLLMYRWEVIIRETAILGILGVTTLGFYIDSAFEDIRYDRAAFLIIVAALLNIGVDSLARRLRGYCGLRQVGLG